jgi:hypothetical protein
MLHLPVPLASADSRIELRDGSVLTGELVGVGEGGFRVRTPLLGELVIPESDVLAVRSVESGSPVRSSSEQAIGQGYQSEIAGIQQQMVADPAIMSSISALQADPELQALLMDPEFSRRVISGDLQALSTDPRLIRLMEHPAIQGIVGRMGVQ